MIKKWKPQEPIVLECSRGFFINSFCKAKLAIIRHKADDKTSLLLRFDPHHGVNLLFAFVDQLLHGAGEVFVVVD